MEDADCSFNKNCTNKVCTGVKVNGACTLDLECVKGNYCNTTNCLAQIKKGSACTRSNECVNSAFCYNKTCTE